MKLIKINTDHYVVVDDSDIKEGDWVYHCNSISIFQYDLDEIADSNYKKITHSTQPLEEGITIHNIEHKRWVYIKYIDLLEVKELIGEVDVEKQEIILTDHQKELLNIGNVSYKDSSIIYYLPYIFINENSKWYMQLEDNKEKKYTRNEVHMLMCKAFEQGWKKADVVEAGLEGLETDVECAWILTSHDSTRTPTEWEVEFDSNGKLKLV